MRMAKKATPGEDSLTTGKKKKTKKGRWKIFVLVAVILVGVFVWYGTQPIKGTIHVGICRSFIELKLEYPDTLRLSAIDSFESTLRIFYTFTDAFGGQRSSIIECTFNPDTTLKEIVIDRQKIPAEKVQAFNATIPYIVAANPDLVVPPPPSADLLLLKKD